MQEVKDREAMQDRARSRAGESQPRSRGQSGRGRRRQPPNLSITSTMPTSEGRADEGKGEGEGGREGEGEGEGVGESESEGEGTITDTSPLDATEGEGPPTCYEVYALELWHGDSDVGFGYKHWLQTRYLMPIECASMAPHGESLLCRMMNRCVNGLHGLYGLHGLHGLRWLNTTLSLRPTSENLTAITRHLTCDTRHPTRNTQYAALNTQRSMAPQCVARAHRGKGYHRPSARPRSRQRLWVQNGGSGIRQPIRRRKRDVEFQQW